MKQYIIRLKSIDYIEREYNSLTFYFRGNHTLNINCANEDIANTLVEEINHYGFSMMGEMNVTYIIDEVGNILNKDGRKLKKK